MDFMLLFDNSALMLLSPMCVCRRSEQAATAALIKNMAAAGQTILTPQLAAELHHSV